LDVSSLSFELMSFPRYVYHESEWILNIFFIPQDFVVLIVPCFVPLCIFHELDGREFPSTLYWRSRIRIQGQSISSCDSPIHVPRVRSFLIWSSCADFSPADDENGHVLLTSYTITRLLLDNFLGEISRTKMELEENPSTETSLRMRICTFY
jgi:hypothetical protein